MTSSRRNGCYVISAAPGETRSEWRSCVTSLWSKPSATSGFPTPANTGLKTVSQRDFVFIFFVYLFLCILFLFFISIIISLNIFQCGNWNASFELFCLFLFCFLSLSVFFFFFFFFFLFTTYRIYHVLNSVTVLIDTVLFSLVDCMIM